ncbi:hypothetical protein ACVW00_003432 [Marmoricola sp. URHA0025 HA25]
MPQRYRTPRDTRSVHWARWLGAIGAILVAVGLYAAWSVLGVRSDLQAARVEAPRLKKALLADDQRGAQASLTRLQHRLSRAHGRTDGPLWSIGAALPVWGDDVDAVRTVAAVGDDLASGTLAELVEESDSDVRAKLIPRQGRVDLGAITKLQPQLARAHRNLNDAVDRTRAVTSSHLHAWVREGVLSLAEQIEQADSALTAADRTAQVLPSMLGADGPRTYLLMFDNNAEIRATGGLPGAYAVLRADRGKLALVQQGTAVDVGQFDQPVLPQSPAEHALYDTQLAEFFQDTNFTPEFPRTAALVRQMWQLRHGQQLDGVISVDAVTLSYLLRATGPVQAPGGVTLTSDNATSELLNQVYFRIPDNEGQDAFFRTVARDVFDKVTAGVESPETLIGALAQGASEGRIYVHSFDTDVQDVLAGTNVAGDLEAHDPRVPQLGIYLNDATGSKMSYYLRSMPRVVSESCAGGQQQFAAYVDLTFTAHSPPADQLPVFITGPGDFGTPKGQQLVLVRLYGPKGGELSKLSVAGEPTQADVVDDRGRPVASTVVLLSRGDTVRVSWRIRSAQGQDRPARLSVTPGITARPAVTRVGDTCTSSGSGRS